MTTTNNLKFPIVEASQSQKHVPVNETFVMLDNLVFLELLGIFVNTPPVSPLGGDRYVVGGSPTGAWAGMAFKIAASVDGVWRFYDPRPGMLAYNTVTDTLYKVDSSFNWVDAKGVIGAFQAYMNSNQTLGIGFTNTVNFNNADHNDYGTFTAGSNKFTAPIDGLYKLDATLQIAATAATAGTIEVSFSKNGTVLPHSINTADAVADTTIRTFVITQLIKLATNDIILVKAGHSAVTSTGQANKNSFSALLVR